MAGEMASRKALAAIVKHAPLVMINLLVEDDNCNILLGLRSHPPARGYWFVPEDRILKNETVQHAVRRIAVNELGIAMDAASAFNAVGVFEHFYPDNLSGAKGFGTHHVVIAQRLTLHQGALTKLCGTSGQHLSYRWMGPRELASAAEFEHMTTCWASVCKEVYLLR
jgi:colanic acid biosynthesis protein WcaH